ncbi:CYTH domain-containing protein [Lachnospiraceae bacterium BSM-380-WT-5A]|uniref:CYTH domain-containing protein n=1 Tax=Oliverpabstia intestinalis TaxID=2606633 RepID=A0A7X2P4V8_9FIRM|nr:CYTH domain-containing protein [Oliverpabstia intestinalis]MST67545.1 CYTH domain-containing protein [Oliverpabstia intestinalis]
MKIREKIIIENEIKFEVQKKKDFMKIFNYLCSNYEVLPYKNALLYDYYFDTIDQKLANKNISYRIRFRPQPSINLKFPHSKCNNIWSRYEYSCKFNKKMNENELLACSCEINSEIKKILEVEQLENSLSVVANLRTYRIGFNIYDKKKNALGKRQLIGVAFFDETRNMDNSNNFFEFEMESYEQTDVFACPYIFQNFEMIGDFMEKNGFFSSEKSKYFRCLEEKK